jgi:hypothetical protein
VLFHKAGRTVMYRVIVPILALWCCGAAAAATLQQLSTDQMTTSATAIVRATVTGSSADFSGSTIYTHYKLQVSEVWKGTGATEVMLPGGVANGFRQAFPGVPVLQKGSEYVLFLWTSQKTGIVHLLGFSQGLFNVVPQPDGTVQASRPLIGEGMIDAKGRPVKDQAVLMQLPDLKARVAAVVAAGAKN